METVPEPSDANADLVHDLARAAERVSVGDAEEMFDSVRARASQRRRRRTSLIGVAAVACLAVSGVVVAQLVGDESGGDRVVSAPTTEPTDDEPVDAVADDAESSETEQADGEADDADAAMTESTEADADAAAEAPASPSDDADAATAPSEATPVQVLPSSVDDAALAATVVNANHLLYPWRGGVLAVSTEFASQPLPDALPEEIRNQFPPEVLELFPDGLPPTMQEAIDILMEADLLDVVVDVLNANPDVNDAVYSEATPPPTQSVRFSTDGIEWSDLDVDLPGGGDAWNGMTSTGERFVVVRPLSDGEVVVTTTGPPPVPDEFEILSSTDLVDWTTQTVPVPDLVAGIDPSTGPQVWLQGVAATDSRYVIQYEVMHDGHFDVAEYVDPELRDRLWESGYSTSEGDQGVTISLDSENSGETETFTFTWEELGLSGPQSDRFGGSKLYRYVGSWDGAPPTPVEIDDVWPQVEAVGDLFVDYGPTAQWSTDGLEWTLIDLPPGEYVNGVVETPTGVAVFTHGPSGENRIHLGDLTTGELQSFSVSDISDRAYPESFGHGAVLIADHNDVVDPDYVDPYADAVGTRDFAEVDGYRYESETTWSSPGGGTPGSETTYRLIDLATGDVVVTETSTFDSFAPEPFEFLEYRSDFGEGFRVLDPTTGEPIVTIPYLEMTTEILNPDGSVTDLSTIEQPEPPIGPMEPPAPDYWVVGFLGDGVIVQSIDGSFEPGFGVPMSAVALDDVVVVLRSNGEIARVTPG